jgi:hypothetical protein
MKFVIAALTLLLTTLTVSAQNYCAGSLSEAAPATDLQGEAREMAMRLIALDPGKVFRADIEFMESIRATLGPTYRQAGDLIASISKDTIEPLSLKNTVEAEKVYTRMSNNVIRLGQYTGYKKSRVAQVLRYAPILEKKRVAALTKEIGHGGYELQLALNKIINENNSMRKAGEDLSKQVEAVAQQIETVKLVIRYFESPEARNGSTEASHEVTRQQIVRHLDHILTNDLLQLFAVGSSLLDAIDKALTRNLDLYSMAYSMLSKDLNVMKAMADRKIDFSLQPRPAPFMTRMRAKHPNFFRTDRNAWKRGFFMGAIVLSVGGSALYVTDTIANSGLQAANPQKTVQMAKKSAEPQQKGTYTPSENRNSEEVAIDGNQSVRSAIEMVNNMSPSAGDRALVQYTSLRSDSISPSQAVALAKATRSQSAQNEVISKFTAVRMGTLSVNEIIDLAALHSTNRDQILVDYLKIWQSSISAKQAMSLARATGQNSGQDEIISIFTANMMGSLSTNQIIELAALHSTNRDGILVDYVNIWKSSISTNQAISLAKATKTNLGQDEIISKFVAERMGILSTNQIIELAALHSTNRDGILIDFVNLFKSSLGKNNLLRLGEAASTQSAQDQILRTGL